MNDYLFSKTKDKVESTIRVRSWLQIHGDIQTRRLYLRIRRLQHPGILPHSRRFQDPLQVSTGLTVFPHEGSVDWVII